MKRLLIAFIMIFTAAAFGQAEQEPVVLGASQVVDESVGSDNMSDNSPAAPVVVPIGKPHIAVYVTGDSAPKEIKDALGVYMLDALVNSGMYRAIERGETFLSAVEQEHLRQRSGDIDDAQIRALGKQSGVQYICVANITVALGSSQVSARLIDVETADVAASGVSSSPLNTLDDLKKVSAAVVHKMLGVRVRVDQNFELLSTQEQTALEQSIARMVEQSVQKSSWRNKKSFWIGLGFDAAGLGMIGYGIYNEIRYRDHNSSGDYSKADKYDTPRYWGYGIGGALLLTGISIQIFF